MNTMQIIAELGGVGAAANLVGGVFSQAFNGYRQAYLDRREEARKDTEVENQDGQVKRKALESSDHAKTLVRFIVLVAFMVISAPVWVPLFSLGLHIIYTLTGHVEHAPSVGVVWYYTKEGSFWLWDWSRLKEYTFGPDNATVTIGILPIFFAISTNIVSFYLLNRVRKKLN